MGSWDLGLGCEAAVVQVVDDLLDDGLRGGGFLLWSEVDAGDLEALQQQAGTFGVEAFFGDALQDVGESEVQGVTVLGHGEVEGGVGALVGAFAERLPGDGAARGVMVVAERLAAQGRAAAAMACGEDVAAEVALRLRLGVVICDFGHEWSFLFWAKSSNNEG